MGLLDFLNEEHPDWEIDNSYLGNLVSLFISDPAVKKAYFGLLHYEGQLHGDLFLAIEHDGEADEIYQMTEQIKQNHLPDQEIFFTSTAIQPELLDHIIESNFPFYVKNKPQALNLAVMKQWFNPIKYKKDLIRHIKTGKIISLFKDFDPLSDTLNFQTFIRNGKEFIPLFTEKDMIPKSGMTELPKDLTMLEFDWRKVDEGVDGHLKEHYYILNPDTSFEVEFIT